MYYDKSQLNSIRKNKIIYVLDLDCPNCIYVYCNMRICIYVTVYFLRIIFVSLLFLCFKINRVKHDIFRCNEKRLRPSQF